jgi:hypothetical protein
VLLAVVNEAVAETFEERMLLQWRGFPGKCHFCYPGSTGTRCAKLGTPTTWSMHSTSVRHCKVHRVVGVASRVTEQQLGRELGHSDLHVNTAEEKQKRL